jgi:N-acetyl-gamma-glutamyl-phosphate reductase
MMTRVAILGATGYTAVELIKLLLRNPDVQITAATTRQESAPPISSIHQSLTGRLDLKCEDLTPEQIAERADFAFCCLPHAASAAVISQLLDAGVRVVDLSADYRLNDPAVYEQWYKVKHPDPDRLATTVYGLPELFGDRIPGENLIANPGCYTSTAILALAPLLARGLIEPSGIIVDGKSGVSGAGRSPKQNVLYAECNESISAYGVGGHRHQPEMEQVLGEVCGQAVDVVFTPHLVPMDRGILGTIYARPTSDAGTDELLATMREFYAGKPFVQIVEHLPTTKDVSGTNYCHITVRRTKGYVTILSALDNLIKGASGVAVQNFNLMAGYPETTGLIPA